MSTRTEEDHAMMFVNRKTCHGLESYLMLPDGLLRLSLLPEKLRTLPQKELMRILDILKDRGEQQALFAEWEHEPVISQD